MENELTEGEEEKGWRELSATRRFFLNTAFFTSTAAVVAGTIYPLIKYLFPDAKRQAGKSEAFSLPLSDLQVGEARFFKFKRNPAIMIRKNDQEVVAMSATCTHLGCVIKYSEGDMVLKCPCHGAKFDLNGKVLGGPAPRPLTIYQASVQGDKVVVEEA